MMWSVWDIYLCVEQNEIIFFNLLHVRHTQQAEQREFSQEERKKKRRRNNIFFPIIVLINFTFSFFSISSDDIFWSNGSRTERIMFSSVMLNRDSVHCVCGMN